jgi:hypothetical protein
MAVGGSFGLVVFAQLIARADAAATWHAIGRAGPFLVIALAPFALGMAFDAYGTIVLLRALGHRTALSRMFPVRVATEALHVSVPAGVVAADTATAALLQIRSGVRLRDGIVVSLARRWLVMRAHTLYIALGALLGFSSLGSLSRSLLGVSWLPWIVLASALVPLALSAALGAGLLGRSTFTNLHAALGRLPSRRLTRWLEARRHDASATDEQVARLRASRTSTTTATCAFLAAWCLEALESALLLGFVGVSLPLASVFAIEAGLSLVRSAVVVAPSGLGAVDLGYATVLPLLGADAGAAPAFVLLKRAKEAIWMSAGYVVLAALRGRTGAVGPPESAAAAPTPAVAR